MPLFEWFPACTTTSTPGRNSPRLALICVRARHLSNQCPFHVKFSPGSLHFTHEKILYNRDRYRFVILDSCVSVAINTIVSDQIGCVFFNVLQSESDLVFDRRERCRQPTVLLHTARAGSSLRCVGSTTALIFAGLCARRFRVLYWCDA